MIREKSSEVKAVFDPFPSFSLSDRIILSSVSILLLFICRTLDISSMNSLSDRLLNSARLPWPTREERI